MLQSRSDKHPLKAIFASMDEQTKRPSHHPWNHRSMKDVIVIEDKAKCKSMMTLPFFISVNLIAALTPMLIVLC